MKRIREWWDKVPSQGGLIGAIVGALVSSRYHKPEDKPLKNAGKTALWSGAGFLAGQWVEKKLRKKPSFAKAAEGKSEK